MGNGERGMGNGEEGRGKSEEGRGKREERRGKREEGRGKSEEEMVGADLRAARHHARIFAGRTGAHPFYSATSIWRSERLRISASNAAPISVTFLPRLSHFS